MKVLFLNHKKFRCGVQQFGKIFYEIIKHCSHRITYVEVESPEWFQGGLYKGFDCIIYNYHNQTMTWLNNEITSAINLWGVKQFCITGHDHNADFSFCKNIICDPTESDTQNTFYIGRPIPFCNIPQNKKYNTLRVGSFGFGFAQKNYTKIVELVNNEFDNAEIHLHVPANDFADPSGTIGRSYLSSCLNSQLKSGISVVCHSDFLSKNDMVYWLSQNDLNIFLYDEQPGRGVSSSTDFALAARKPFGISSSNMFRHLKDNEDILVEKNSLKSIIERGTKPLEQYYDKWSHENFRKRFEEILCC